MLWITEKTVLSGLHQSCKFPSRGPVGAWAWAGAALHLEQARYLVVQCGSPLYTACVPPGYMLAICADFLAGANLDSVQPEVLLHSLSRFFQFLPGEQRHAFLQQLVNGDAP